MHLNSGRTPALANPFPKILAMHPAMPVTAFLLSLAGHLQETTGECCLAYGRLLVPCVQDGNGERFVSLEQPFLHARKHQILLLVSLSSLFPSFPLITSILLHDIFNGNTQAESHGLFPTAPIHQIQSTIVTGNIPHTAGLTLPSSVSWQSVPPKEPASSYPCFSLSSWAMPFLQLQAPCRLFPSSPFSYTEGVCGLH